MRIVASVNIDRPASQVWAYVADYGNDTSGRGGVTQMRPSQPGPAQEGVTTHELLRVLGMTFRTDATIDRVEPGRRLQWLAHDRQSSCAAPAWSSRVARPAAGPPTRSRAACSARLDSWSRWWPGCSIGRPLPSATPPGTVQATA
jgi:polyketide cyclase/dehydrase/lipid transport protein